jgi:hypothetical protein
VVENWPEGYKSRISQLITKTIIEKMIDVLKNARFSEYGVKVLKADFQRIFKTFCEYLEEYYYNQINDIVFLIEIFSTPKESVDSFIDTISTDMEKKYDVELLKMLVKKRKNLKI